MMTEQQLQEIEQRMRDGKLWGSDWADLLAEVRRLQVLMADNPQVITNDTLKAQRDAALAERDKAIGNRDRAVDMANAVVKQQLKAEAAITEARRMLRLTRDAADVKLGISEQLDAQIAAVLAQED